MDIGLYDAESYQIPDSDAKIYMSLDDIIKLEGIKKPGPGSVRSLGSRRTAYSHRSNRSHRSTYSHKSNRSHRSSYSHKSNRSHRSNYSNRSHRSNYSNRSHRSSYSNQFYRLRCQNIHSNMSNRSGYDGIKFVQNRAGFQGRGRHANGYQFKYLNRPSVYNPNARPPFQYYRHAVRNAVRTLTTRVSKPNNMKRLGSYGGRQMKNFFRNAQPSDIVIECGNSRQNTPLTKHHLAVFNKMQRNLVHKKTGSYKSSFSQSYNYRRHSVQYSVNKTLQREIAILQSNAKFNGSENENDFSNMEFSPIPHSTSQLINDRFSSYD